MTKWRPFFLSRETSRPIEYVFCKCYGKKEELRNKERKKQEKRRNSNAFLIPFFFQENLRALQARDAKLAREREEEEQREREELLEQGLNPDEIMTRRKRIRQFERDKE